MPSFRSTWFLPLALAFAFLSTLVLLPVFGSSQVADHLLLSEVAYDPIGDEPGGEWVELFNATDTSLDLAGWKLVDNASQDTIPDFLLAPDEYLVVAAQEEAFRINYPDFTGNLVALGGAIGNGLGNESDRVLLVDASGGLQDAMSYGEDATAFDPACPDVPEGQSLARTPPDRDTDSAADWSAQEVPNPGSAGAPPAATPTATSTPSPLPTTTPTSTRTGTPTITLTFTPTLTESPAATATPTETTPPLATDTPPAAPTLTIAPVASATATGTSTATPTAGPTGTPTPTAELTATASPTGAPVEPRLLLSEVLYDALQEGPDSAWEWVEVFNPTGQTVNLAGWRIGDNGGQDVLPAVELPAGGYLVIAATAAGFWENHPDFVGNLVALEDAIGNGLGNTGDVVRLSAPDGMAIDAMSYDANADAFDPPCPGVAPGQSLARVPSWLDTDTAADWAVQTSPNPGGPGAPGAATPTPTATRTLTATVAPLASLTPTPSFTPTLTPFPAQPGDIVINEIMQNPAAVLDQDGEWFEVYNATDQAIDLNGWTIKDDGSDHHRIANGGPLWLPAGGYLVLGRNANPVVNGGLNVAYRYAGVILANGADEIILLDPSGAEIDRVAYDGGATFPAPTGASMMLIQPEVDNNAGGNWRTAIVHWPGSMGDAGSPGAANHTARIEGYVFEDRNGNGRRDLDEIGLGIGGVPITVRGAGPGGLTSSQRTYPSGWYGFYDLPADTYQVIETQPEGYTSTTPDQVTVSLPPGGMHLGLVFGEQYPTPTPASTALPGASPTPADTATVTPAATHTVTVTPDSTFTPTPTATLTPTATSLPALLPPVRLNELLPRPDLVDWDGNGTVDAYDEWIELFNGGPDAVDLGGWMLDDILEGGSSPYVFPAGILLPPGGFLVRYRSGTGVALNQDADTAHLLAPDGRVVDSFAYSGPQRDISYSRTVDGAGEWTDTYPASPGGPNIAPTATPTHAPTTTPTPSRTPTPTATMTAVIYDPNAIRLNEVLPAPSAIDWDGSGTADAEDEWIELYNVSAVVVDLAGWMLDDVAEGGTRPYALPADARLSPGAFLVLYRSATGVALNNDGDTVRLLGPDGAEIDAFTYAGSSADDSYSRVIDGTGAWTAVYPPSPGRANAPATPAPTATITPTATRTATPTITPTATSTATPTQFPAGITLNEILPNPQAEDWDEDGVANYRDEWVELYNAGSAPAALGGWALADASTVYTLPVGTVIWPASYLLLFRGQTDLMLSDYRDEVRLLRPDAVVADRFAYDSGPGADRSYCRSSDGGGYWTKECYVTPGGANRLLPASTSSGGDPAPTATPAGGVVSIAAARAAAVDTRVTVTGTVIYPPGLLARTLYIQDATAGIKVYLRAGDFPPLALGDTVRVTGWTRDFHGEAEISAPNPGYLAALAHGAAPVPLPITTGSMGEAHEGRLVWLAGRIVRFETRALVLDDGSGPARIYFPEELPWRRPYVNIGEFWSAQGVVGQYAFDGPPWVGGYRLAPRVAADVSDRPVWLPVTGGG